VVLAFVLVLAACVPEDRAGPDGRADGTPPLVERPGAVHPSRERVPFPRVAFGAGVPLDHAEYGQLAAAARRFAVTLAAWLYGDRREIDVEPTRPGLRRQLATAPPYVPSDQIGTGDGQAALVEIHTQTPRSGVLIVTIFDRRTSYRIPATIEMRAGRWQIVRLNSE
jgi:hypothetical protein